MSLLHLRPVANAHRGEEKTMYVDRTVDMKTWLKKHESNLKLDLRDEGNRKLFAEEVLDLKKEWGNIVEEFDDATTHMEKFQRFSRMIAETNTTCKERKLGGPIEMMHRQMGLNHVMTASSLDHNSGLLRFNSLQVASMHVPNKNRGSKKTDEDLRERLEYFMDPENTNLGMFTDLIPVKMRWPCKSDTDMTKLCAACKIHSEDIMDRKREVANRSGSSLVGDIAENFLLSMKVKSIRKSPSMENAVKVSRLPKPDRRGKKYDYDSWLCEVFKDKRWTDYVESPNSRDAQEGVTALLAIKKMKVPFYLDYERIATQPGDLKVGKEWRLDGLSRNLLYLIPQITLVAFASQRNQSVHDYKLKEWNEQRKKVTNYIAEHHTGSECNYASSITLHQEIHDRFDQTFKDQQSFVHNLHPVIGFVVAVGMMINSCIAEASYPDLNGNPTTAEAKLESIHSTAKRLKSMFSTMDKQPAGSIANFEATMIHFGEFLELLQIVKIYSFGTNSYYMTRYHHLCIFISAFR